MWEQFGPGAVGIGWEMALMGLDEHLRTPDADPAQVQEWIDRARGTALPRRVHDRCAATQWIDASIAAGTDPEAPAPPGNAAPRPTPPRPEE